MDDAPVREERAERVNQLRPGLWPGRFQWRNEALHEGTQSGRRLLFQQGFKRGEIFGPCCGPAAPCDTQRRASLGGCAPNVREEDLGAIATHQTELNGEFVDVNFTHCYREDFALSQRNQPSFERFMQLALRADGPARNPQVSHSQTVSLQFRPERGWVGQPVDETSHELTEALLPLTSVPFMLPDRKLEDASELRHELCAGSIPLTLPRQGSDTVRTQALPEHRRTCSLEMTRVTSSGSLEKPDGALPSTGKRQKLSDEGGLLLDVRVQRARTMRQDAVVERHERDPVL